MAATACADGGPLHADESDHLVPSRSPAPLTIRATSRRSRRTPNPKEEFERRLREMVCAGAMPLATAQGEIAANWVVLYDRPMS